MRITERLLRIVEAALTQTEGMCHVGPVIAQSPKF